MKFKQLFCIEKSMPSDSLVGWVEFDGMIYGCSIRKLCISIF